MPTGVNLDRPHVNCFVVIQPRVRHAAMADTGSPAHLTPGPASTATCSGTPPRMTS